MAARWGMTTQSKGPDDKKAALSAHPNGSASSQVRPSLLPQGARGGYGQGVQVDHRDGAYSEDDGAARFGAGRSQGDARSSVRSGAAAPATRGCALVTPAPWPPMPPHALPVPEYRLALRVGSVPKPRVGMQAVCPWGQDMPYGDRIASVKFSLAERLPGQVKSERLAHTSAAASPGYGKNPAGQT